MIEDKKIRIKSIDDFLKDHCHMRKEDGHDSSKCENHCKKLNSCWGNQSAPYENFEFNSVKYWKKEICNQGYVREPNKKSGFDGIFLSNDKKIYFHEAKYHTKKKWQDMITIANRNFELSSDDKLSDLEGITENKNFVAIEGEMKLVDKYISYMSRKAETKKSKENIKPEEEISDRFVYSLGTDSSRNKEEIKKEKEKIKNKYKNNFFLLCCKLENLKDE